MLIAAAEAAFVDFLSQIEATSLWHRRTHTLLTALSGGPDSLALALIAEARCNRPEYFSQGADY